MKEQLTNDMSVGNPAKKLFFFAVPIVLFRHFDLSFLLLMFLGMHGFLEK